MKDVTRSEQAQNDLILHALGAAPAEASERVNERARADVSLALQLELMRAYLGEPLQTDSEARAIPDSRTRFALRRIRSFAHRRKYLAAACLLLALAGLACGGYALLAPKPLLEDNFNGSSGKRAFRS